MGEREVRLANTEGHRSKASYLIKRRYAWRGYQSSGLSENLANRITLAAFDGEQTIATITVGIDSPAGLAVEALYPDEVKALRTAGRHLCEFTKLAVDNMVRSKAVLAAIFHIAYIYGHRMRRCTDVVIEVNPRHVRFYRSMLGFEPFGEERIDPRVNAPAVLLHLDLRYASEQISMYGGGQKPCRRSLYPAVFSPQEQEALRRKIESIELTPSFSVPSDRPGRRVRDEDEHHSTYLPLMPVLSGEFAGASA